MKKCLFSSVLKGFLEQQETYFFFLLILKNETLAACLLEYIEEENPADSYKDKTNE